MSDFINEPLSKFFQECKSFQSVQKVYFELDRAGYEVYLAGGCVRDGLLKRVPNDFDIATNATPDEVQKVFAKSLDVGKQFGVIVVLIDGEQVEVATFRNDGVYTDGRRPEKIEFSSAKEDALRRDFTINALFYDLKSEKIIDYVGGVSDLHRKTIRAVGEPLRRFEEDHLRILRAIRFSSQLGFEIEKNTLNAVLAMSPMITKVSRERIQIEIEKTFLGPHWLKALGYLFDANVFKVLFKDLNLLQNEFSKMPILNDEHTIWVNLFLALKKCNENFDCKKELGNWKFSGQTKTAILHALDWDQERLHNISVGEAVEVCFDSYSQYGLSQLELTDALLIQKRNSINERLKVLKVKPEPFLRASDLAEKSGRELGDSLRRTYWAQLEGVVKDVPEALSFAKALK